MYKHWWNSIRWRLALGSMLVVLIATTALALATLLAITRVYGADQQSRLSNLAGQLAQDIGESYLVTNNLQRSVMLNVPAGHLRDLAGTGLFKTAQGESYLMFVLTPTERPAYPLLRTLNPRLQSASFLRQLLNVKQFPNDAHPDLAKIREAFVLALEGNSTMGEVSVRSPVARPFVVQPIVASGQGKTPVVGVLVMLPQFAVENTIPPFLTAVGQAVLIVSIIVAVIAMSAAIIFSRTITRPLAHLTTAAQVLAKGDYNVQVQVNSHNELGELAHTFNEMATQLNRDVEMLRQQELWRRELIMSVTHDLATPLTAIAGLGESLLDGVNQSREDYEETGQIIVRETLRLRRLVKDLHVMAKVEAGALKPQLQPVRLGALVDEVLAVFATEFERVQVEPRNLIPYNMPVLQADPDMLTRIFSNLCDNALRHTPANGSITIDAQPTEGGRAALISVTDTGDGIPPEALSRIFERFYRADNARHSSTGGSGLGLAIVQAIVEAHGGRIWAENVPGAGARMAFTLPLS